jgi:hypothetical protein
MVWAEAVMAVYLAVAYRFGWTNSHHYFVASGVDLATVQAAAEHTWEDRSGKYGVVVLEMPQDMTSEAPKRLAYFPSSYGEAAPAENARIEAFKTLGQRAYGAVSHGKTSIQRPDGSLAFIPVDVPSWLRLEAHRAALLHGIVYAPQMNLLPPTKKTDE